MVKAPRVPAKMPKFVSKEFDKERIKNLVEYGLGESDSDLYPDDPCTIVKVPTICGKRKYGVTYSYIFEYEGKFYEATYEQTDDGYDFGDCSFDKTLECFEVLPQEKIIVGYVKKPIEN